MKPVVLSLDNLYLKDDAINRQRQRYNDAIATYKAYFQSGGENIRLFSAPGRTEIAGNHTDHNRGKVLTASADLDIIAVVEPMDVEKIVIKSKGFSEVGVWLSEGLEPVADETGTTAALIRGMAAGFAKRKKKIGGFKAYTASNVPVAAGLASSAAFETLIGTILNYLYNNGRMDPLVIAKIGGEAENVFWGKAGGLLDQCACATGGFAAMDFKDGDPVVEHIPFDLSEQGYSLCLVRTRTDRVDISVESVTISAEMKSVASFFGAEYLREIAKKDILFNMSDLRRACGDRAVLRSLHFFAENDRVNRMVYALQKADFAAFLACVHDSGDSSYKFLQNIYPSGETASQSTALGILTAEASLHGKGAVRVPGVGFAGTVQAYVPIDMLKIFRMDVEKVFGAGSVLVLDVRDYGGVEVILN